MNGVFDRFEAEVIRVAIGHASFDAAAGQQHREAVIVVVSTRLDFDEAPDLNGRRSAEFTTDHQQRFVEKSRCFQIFDQLGHGLV